MIVNFLKFKNYYSRELKRFDTIAEYEPYLVGQIADFNFNPNDDISATVDQITEIPDCDYIVMTDYNVLGVPEIVSRWYIIEAKRELKSYYTLTLFRDVLADFWNEIKEAPAFIEKATIADSDPLIFNKENVRTNQIKQSETLLQDSLQCAWICGYVKKDYPGATIEIEANAIADLDKATWGLDNLINKDVYNFLNQEQYYFYYQLVTDQISNEYLFTCNSSGWNWKQVDYGNNKRLYTWLSKAEYGIIPKIIDYLNQNYSYNKLHTEAIKDPYAPASGYSANNYASVIAVNNKTLQDGTLYYSVSAPISEVTKAPIIASSSTLYNLFEEMKNNFPYRVSERGTDGTLWNTSASLNASKLTLSPIASGKYTITIPAATARNHLSDAPYDMFYIPYDCSHLEVSDQEQTYSANWSKSQAISFAQGIAEQLSNQYLIDLQILPYHPDPTNIELKSRPWGPTLKFIMKGDNSTFNLITDANKSAVGVIGWATKSSGTINIWSPITSGNKKLDNQTRFYRLCSPNWNGQFEFTPEMVGDKLSYFNVDYTYLPYQPYIHVAPIFEKGSMYGDDYNDARGLICGGDFSITYLSDRWAEYKVQNKNYENIFLRQIQNMEVQHKYSMIDAAVGATVGAAEGAVSGLKFGPAGAVASGIASAAGGAADLAIKQGLHNEAIDFARDNFQMQIENIQALPDSISKVTAINENNKVYPVLECYDCTDKEKTALANKIRYSGMTAGIIGTISEYINNSWSYNGIQDKGYLKGYFIQIPKLSNDYHLVSTISEEFKKGVYTK